MVVDVDTTWTEVWRGKQQVRTYQVDGKRLTLIVAPQPSSTQPGKTLTSRSVWEKID
jgi:Lipocalin-like domain